MNVNIILFGQLTDITGTGNLVLADIADTDSLVKELNRRYPDFANAKYMIAVDKKVVTENIAIGEHTTIALMPAFSGG
jgi:molybdopterin converting factor small subunit